MSCCGHRTTGAGWCPCWSRPPYRTGRSSSQPSLVFFFDEAPLLFNGASKAFLDSLTQTVRLIRSKGVGVFYVMQTAKDVPAAVLAQFGNRVQHALRAFTPDDQKALKATDLEELLTGLGTGEAVVTVLSEKGAPRPSPRPACALPSP
ncbi:hypothetical protein SCANM124S_05240 [Streptomyces canus]